MSSDPRNVLTLEAARAAGVTRHALAHRVRCGEWQRIFPRVYVTYSGTVSKEARLAAALAYAGEGAVLSHETAAERHRLDSWSDLIHVTVPNGRRVVPQPGIVIRYSRHLPDTDKRTVRGLRCTSVERTVIDLVGAARTPGSAAAVVLDAVQARRTTTVRLRAAVLDSPPRRYAVLVAQVLSEAAEGTHSMLELHFGSVCRDHGLMVGERQRRQKSGGAVTYRDNVLVGFGIVTELDGLKGHDKAREQLRDMWRDNVNVVLGNAPLRHGWSDVLDRPCQVAQQRAAVLRSRGWQGPLIECGPGCVVAQPIEAAEG